MNDILCNLHFSNLGLHETLLFCFLPQKHTCVFLVHRHFWRLILVRKPVFAFEQCHVLKQGQNQFVSVSFLLRNFLVSAVWLPEQQLGDFMNTIDVLLSTSSQKDVCTAARSSHPKH